MTVRLPGQGRSIRLAAEDEDPELFRKLEKTRGLSKNFDDMFPGCEGLTKASLELQKFLERKLDFGEDTLRILQQPMTLNFPEIPTVALPVVPRSLPPRPGERAIVDALNQLNSSQRDVVNLLSMQNNKGQESARAKGKPGRKATWDWDGAIAYLFKIANTPDGLPTVQAEVERIVRDWFMTTTGDHPAESTIRERVQRWGREIFREAGN